MKRFRLKKYFSPVLLILLAIFDDSIILYILKFKD